MNNFRQAFYSVLLGLVAGAFALWLFLTFVWLAAWSFHNLVTQCFAPGC